MDRAFRFVALPAERFATLFEASDAELRALGARLERADAKPGFPCRASLQDAEPGERVVLLPWVHLDVASPYRASGPIYVREGAVTARPEPGEVPPFLATRLVSLRAYDGRDLMVDAEAVSGTEVEAGILALLREDRVKYLQVHNARTGCFLCGVVREG
ncbi:MAG: DUF1203 domain-containing protein [Anaeromyxobacter sp.]